MKLLYNQTNLVEYGIQPLTGEACGYSMRMLCDVSDKGRELLAGYFGMPEMSLPPAWNSRVGEEPSTGSIMLPRATIRDLLIYILFHVEKCDVILDSPDGSLNGLKKNDRYYQQYMDMVKDSAVSVSVLRNPSIAAVSRNGRNIHSFSGRTV